MKRQRESQNNKGNQLKISRFFPVTHNNEDSKVNSNTAQTKAANLSKSLKVNSLGCLQ